jgi:hypothetical protein
LERVLAAARALAEARSASSPASCLRRSQLGHRNGLPVVIKALRTDEEFWQAKFTHEIRLYQAFTATPNTHHRA